METVRFSKIKLVSDLMGQLVSAAVLITILNLIFSSEIFHKPASFIVLYTLLFMGLMMLLYIFSLFAFPTMVAITFYPDHLIFRYVKGYGERTVFYNDIKWIRKTGVLGQRFHIRINEETIPLALTLFNKSDRSDIVKTIQHKAAT
jgi:hypothetical protein